MSTEKLAAALAVGLILLACLAIRSSCGRRRMFLIGYVVFACGFLLLEGSLVGKRGSYTAVAPAGLWTKFEPAPYGNRVVDYGKVRNLGPVRARKVPIELRAFNEPAESLEVAFGSDLGGWTRVEGGLYYQIEFMSPGDTTYVTGPSVSITELEARLAKWREAERRYFRDNMLTSIAIGLLGGLLSIALFRHTPDIK